MDENAMSSKGELESRKLQLEIAELSRPFWARPAYLLVLLPIVLATITFLSALLSGYFDRERANLAKEIVRLREERDALREENADNAEARKELFEAIEKIDQTLTEANKKAKAEERK